MGYNATVVVLVDQLNAIESDPQFGKKLADAIRHKLRDPNNRHGSDPYVPGQTQVVEVHHADAQVAVAVGGNSGQVLGVAGSYVAKPDEMIKNLNDDRLWRKRQAIKDKASKKDGNL